MLAKPGRAIESPLVVVSVAIAGFFPRFLGHRTMNILISISSRLTAYCRLYRLNAYATSSPNPTFGIDMFLGRFSSDLDT